MAKVVPSVGDVASSPHAFERGRDLGVVEGTVVLQGSSWEDLFDRLAEIVVAVFEEVFARFDTNDFCEHGGWAVEFGWEEVAG